MPNLRVEAHHPGRPVSRVILHEEGLAALLVTLAAAGAGRAVVEIYVSNNSENLRLAGYNQATLSFRVPKLTGCYGFSLDAIEGLTSSGFTLQGPGVVGKYPAADVPVQTWAYLDGLAERYGDTPIVGRFGPPETAENAA